VRLPSRPCLSCAILTLHACQVAFGHRRSKGCSRGWRAGYPSRGQLHGQGDPDRRRLVSLPLRARVHHSNLCLSPGAGTHPTTSARSPRPRSTRSSRALSAGRTRARTRRRPRGQSIARISLRGSSSRRIRIACGNGPRRRLGSSCGSSRSGSARGRRGFGRSSRSGFVCGCMYFLFDGEHLWSESDTRRTRFRLLSLARDVARTLFVTAWRRTQVLRLRLRVHQKQHRALCSCLCQLVFDIATRPCQWH
jgi:hypothetical protein